jgi:hypothetical protein
MKAKFLKGDDKLLAIERLRMNQMVSFTGMITSETFAYYSYRISGCLFRGLAMGSCQRSIPRREDVALVLDVDSSLHPIRW